MAFARGNNDPKIHRRGIFRRREGRGGGGEGGASSEGERMTPSSRWTEDMRATAAMLRDLPCLLASDLLIGVAFASSLRSFGRRTMTTTTIAMASEQGATTDARMTSSSGMDATTNATTTTMTRWKARHCAPPAAMGLRNGGQTCYANATFQALSSLRPVVSYLESLASAREGGEVEVESALLRTLQYANGRGSAAAAMGRRRDRRRPRATGVVRSLLPSWLSSSMSYASERDVRTIMNAVATSHAQFRSRGGLSSLSGAHEQQDSHEFFLALMDVLSTRDTNATTTTTTTMGVCFGDGDGISCDLGGTVPHPGGSGMILAVADVPPADVGVRRERDRASAGGGARRPLANNDEFEEEKKHEDNNHGETEEMEDMEGMEENEKMKDSFHPPSRSYAVGLEPPVSSRPSPEKTTARGMAGSVAPMIPAASRRGRPRNNPFDGWVGSAIKCASCRHVRPVRATPFLGLSLPIANVRSEFVEDILAAEYGGFSNAERVQDVRCLSCGVMGRTMELETEATLIDGAIGSIRRRRCGRMGGDDDGHRGDDDDVIALVRESNRIRRKIAVLGTVDPDDADDDDILDYNDDYGDSMRGMDLGIGDSNLRIVPVRGDAYRASLLMRPPEVLCIHIQRRHYDPSSGKISKVTRHVRFGERLNLSPYCAYGEASFEEEEEEEGRRVLPGATSRSDRIARTIPYELMSVIEHNGNAFGGHYQTYRRVGLMGKDWVLVSDENVASRTWSEVRRCQAYMLFYVATPSNENPP